MTTAQARGLEQLPKYLLSDAGLHESFQREARVLVEIGFGNGDVLADFAVGHEDWNCVGVEVFHPGIGALVNRCEALGLGNVRIVESEGLTYLESLVPQTVDLLWVLFPDPWPKARHHKRRLITTEFGEAAARCLKTTGRLQIATDWADYAEQIKQSLSGIANLTGGIAPSDSVHRQTKYESRGLRLGHEVVNFEYVKVN